MRNGLTVATWALTDVGPGDGGFVCIPGSHKTNFLPNLPDDVRRQERLPDYVHQPPVRAGDVLIFTEALIHGSAPWRAGHERRALLYKVQPSALDVAEGALRHRRVSRGHRAATAAHGAAFGGGPSQGARNPVRDAVRPGPSRGRQ